jgi:hypothetical protein
LTATQAAACAIGDERMGSVRSAGFQLRRRGASQPATDAARDGCATFGITVNRERPSFLVVPSVAPCDIQPDTIVTANSESPGNSAPARPKLTDVIGSFPYRIQLAGGWIDQPFVSQLNPSPPGSMVVVSLEPEFPFMDRAGMATGSRKIALQLWPGCRPGIRPAWWKNSTRRKTAESRTPRARRT